MPPGIVVLTGAGISKESGIDTFRDKDGLWTRVDLEEVATIEAWHKDKKKVLDFYNDTRKSFRAAHIVPNAAHKALARLEQKYDGEVTVVTQNIDPLHERAGSARVAKVHGSADRCRCSDSMCRLGAVESIALDAVDFTEFDREPRLAAIPACPACGSRVRPHVLWFDELYVSHADYQWHVLDAAAGRITLLICVGTSLAVGVTSFLQSAAAAAGAPVFLIDPGERPRDAHHAMVHVRARAEELLPEVVGILSGD